MLLLTYLVSLHHYSKIFAVHQIKLQIRSPQSVLCVLEDSILHVRLRGPFNTEKITTCMLRLQRTELSESTEAELDFIVALDCSAKC